MTTFNQSHLEYVQNIPTARGHALIMVLLFILETRSEIISQEHIKKALGNCEDAEFSKAAIALHNQAVLMAKESEINLAAIKQLLPFFQESAAPLLKGASKDPTFILFLVQSLKDDNFSIRLVENGKTNKFPVSSMGTLAYYCRTWSELCSAYLLATHYGSTSSSLSDIEKRYVYPCKTAEHKDIAALRELLKNNPSLAHNRIIQVYYADQLLRMMSPTAATLPLFVHEPDNLAVLGYFCQENNHFLQLLTLGHFYRPEMKGTKLWVLLGQAEENITVNVLKTLYSKILPPNNSQSSEADRYKDKMALLICLYTSAASRSETIKKQFSQQFLTLLKLLRTLSAGTCLNNVSPIKLPMLKLLTSGDEKFLNQIDEVTQAPLSNLFSLPPIYGWEQDQHKALEITLYDNIIYCLCDALIESFPIKNYKNLNNVSRTEITDKNIKAMYIIIESCADVFLKTLSFSGILRLFYLLEIWYLNILVYGIKNPDAEKFIILGRQFEISTLSYTEIESVKDYFKIAMQNLSEVFLKLYKRTFISWLLTLDNPLFISFNNFYRASSEKSLMVRLGTQLLNLNDATNEGKLTAFDIENFTKDFKEFAKNNEQELCAAIRAAIFMILFNFMGHDDITSHNLKHAWKLFHFFAREHTDDDDELYTKTLCASLFLREFNNKNRKGFMSELREIPFILKLLIPKELSDEYALAEPHIFNRLTGHTVMTHPLNDMMTSMIEYRHARNNGENTSDFSKKISDAMQKLQTVKNNSPPKEPIQEQALSDIKKTLIPNSISPLPTQENAALPIPEAAKPVCLAFTDSSHVPRDVSTIKIHGTIEEEDTKNIVLRILKSIGNLAKKLQVFSKVADEKELVQLASIFSIKKICGKLQELHTANPDVTEQLLKDSYSGLPAVMSVINNFMLRPDSFPPIIASVVKEFSQFKSLSNEVDFHPDDETQILLLDRNRKSLDLPVIDLSSFTLRASKKEVIDNSTNPKGKSQIDQLQKDFSARWKKIIESLDVQKEMLDGVSDSEFSLYSSAFSCRLLILNALIDGIIPIIYKNRLDDPTEAHQNFRIHYAALTSLLDEAHNDEVSPNEFAGTFTSFKKHANIFKKEIDSIFIQIKSAAPIFTAGTAYNQYKN